MNRLFQAQNHLSKISIKDSKPSDYEFFRYLLISKVGLSVEEFNNSPAPLLMSLMDCYLYEQKEKEKAMKRK